MRPNQFVIAGIVVWVICVVASLLHAALHDPGPGYLSGLENVLIFFLWQIGGLVVAFATMIARLVAHQSITGALRWLGFIPIILSGTFAIVIAVWILTAE